MIPLSYNVRSLLLRKTTTFATVLGVALVVPIILSALLTGGLMGIIGGFLPAIRAARTSPLVAMRD
jgi:ABC-type antimicrobial peptide transport system permease subunit